MNIPATYWVVAVCACFLLYCYWRLVLRTSGKGWSSSAYEAKELIGKAGVAKSLLRPGGIAVIEGERMHVITDGSAVEEGTPVVVVAVTGGNVVVKPALPM